MGKLTRRELIIKTGTLAAGLAGLQILGGEKAWPSKESGSPPLPWPYKKLDPEAVAQRAYEGYFAGACAYGVYESIVGSLQKEVGAPYTGLPVQLMAVGEGGVAGTATLCGCLYAGSQVLFLTSGKFEKEGREKGFTPVRQLWLWYESEALPDWEPKSSRTPSVRIPASIARSQLCHVSISNWCKASGKKSFSPDRAERCARLTASTARRIVLTLNSIADGSFKPVYKLSTETEKCRSCHDKGGLIENTRAITDSCNGCHFTRPTNHSALK